MNAQEAFNLATKRKPMIVKNYINDIYNCISVASENGHFYIIKKIDNDFFEDIVEILEKDEFIVNVNGVDIVCIRWDHLNK